MFIIWLLLQYTALSNANTTKHCNFVSIDVFNNCAEMNTHHTKENNIEDMCLHESICRRTFKTSRVHKQVFSYTMFHVINSLISHCCGKCANVNIINNFTYMSEVNQFSINSSDFVYPILGRYLQNQLYGHYFIPSFDLPTAYYFTLGRSNGMIVKDTISSCLHLWPLLIICILAAVIAGFIIWMMETRLNAEEFSRTFHVGLFEGFWWSFVSMTTVGYGDKSPRSFPGRIFAICWILFGITICSIFTASLTTEIIKNISPVGNKIAGKVVGCLNYRLNDAALIAQHGGIVHTIEYNDTTVGIGELMLLLKDEVINGFIINRQIYYDFIRNIKKPIYTKQAVISQISMCQIEVHPQQDRLAYGMLVKNHHDYQYFRTFFENNWLHLQACQNIKNNHKMTSMPNYGMDFFALKGGLLTSFLHLLIGILCAIFCFGLIYELRRHYRGTKVESIF